MKMRFEQMSGNASQSVVPEMPKREKAPSDPIKTEIMALRKELAEEFARYRDEENIEKYRDEILKKYPDMSMEMINLFMDLSWEINAMHQEDALTKAEAETMIALLMKSKGRDNLTTMAIFMTCGEKKKTWKMNRD